MRRRKETVNLGNGPKEWTFPIVQEETVRHYTVTALVRADTFIDALAETIIWSMHYSQGKPMTFWPLVKYCGERRYVKALSSQRTYAYAESSDAGAWVPVGTLEGVG